MNFKYKTTNKIKKIYITIATFIIDICGGIKF